MLSPAEPRATTRPMLRLEPSPRPGGHQPGLLPLLLALLGTTWAGVQPLQLQEQRVPMAEGKGEGNEGPGGFQEPVPRPEPRAGWCS